MLSKVTSSIISWVFGITWPGIEPWFPGSLPNKGAHGIMVIVVGNGYGKLSESVYISHSTNILGNGMHPTILSPSLSKLGRMGFLT